DYYCAIWYSNAVLF
nr:immunoglobulin light chain junction region [Macaca mulatta]